MNAPLNAPRVELNRVAGATDLARAAAALFANLSRRAVSESGRFAVALSGGSTPQGMYEVLASEPFRDAVAWDRLEFFWSDERAVAPDHFESNFRAVRAALLSTVPVSEARIHRMPAERPDLDVAARAYQEEIAGALGVPADGPPPALDLVLLGLGGDGHIASLFPHTTEPEEMDRWVTPTAVPGTGAGRLTLTSAMINRARCVAFLVGGAEKAEPVAAALEGPHDFMAIPARRIRPSAGRVVWFLDHAAASGLTGSVVRPLRLAPSILSADFARLGPHVAEAEHAGADRLHVDVMDGHFVPNLSIGTPIVKSLRRATPLSLETHLMITDPEQYAEPFVRAGSDRIQFHHEVVGDPVALARTIRDLGASPGIVINPDTPASAVRDAIAHVDMVLVMTVHPGFGGQSFIEGMLPKVAELRRMIAGENPICEIEVDGGIGPDTAARAYEAGASVLVAGSAIFSRPEGVAAAMEKICAAVPCGRDERAAVTP